MTVKADLDRAIAMAEASKGNYLLFSTESEDKKATQVFQDMAQDMERHVKILESRVDYLTQHNQLNASDSSGGGGGQSGSGSGNNNKDKKKQQNQNSDNSN
ncbi:MAG TPA: DUF1657 domain-containing protein [Symbiobacteriaceae bacterium]|jgi:hypothetical protein